MNEWVCTFKSDVKFRCIRCANCCRNISQGLSLTEKDYVRVRNVVRDVGFAEPFRHSIFSFNMKTLNRRCIFLYDKNCSIHEVRPLLCRLYPLQLSVRHDGKLLLCLNRCPGFGHPKGDVIEETFVKGVLKTILELEGESFIKKLRISIMNIKKRVTPLLNTRKKTIYSNWRTKIALEKLIFDIIYNNSFDDLTPKERLQCIYEEVLPLLSHKIVNSGRSFVTEQYLARVWKEMEKINFAKCATSMMRRREEIKREGILIHKKTSGPSAYHSVEDDILIRNPQGQNVLLNVGSILGSIPIDPYGVEKELEYLWEIIKREGTYGAIICALPVDAEVLLLLLVSDALELYANAFTIHSGQNSVEAQSIAEAISKVDQSLTGLATRVIM